MSYYVAAAARRHFMRAAGKGESEQMELPNRHYLPTIEVERRRIRRDNIKAVAGR